MPSDAQPPAEILVADGEESIRALLEATLRDQGYLVRTVSDGEACLREVAARPPDLILCDIQMPGFDGIEVCKRLKGAEKTRHIPLVLMTAERETSRRLEAIEAGVDDLLIKDLDVPELLARTRVLISSKRLHDDLRRQSRIIDSLLAISTLSPGYTDSSTRMFADFGRHAAKLLRADSVAVVLQRRGRPPELLNCWPMKDHDLIQRKISSSIALGALLATHAPLVVEQADRQRQDDLGLDEGFVGVPMTSFTGEVIGAVLAFGTPSNLPPTSVKILMTLAQRVGAEVQLQDHSEHLEELVRERTRDVEAAKAALEEANEEMIFRLALAVECRDKETANHIRRISRFSELLARAVNLGEDQVFLIRSASMLHDIGKLGVPEPILQKPGKLTPGEYEQMKLHTVRGAQVCQGSRSPQLKMAEKIALAHHEWWNGHGYPHGRKGEEIPIEARIVAVADIFDALISRRPYKPAWSFVRAFEHVTSLAGTHLDPRLVEAFLHNFDRITEIAAHLSSEPVTLWEDGTPPGPRGDAPPVVAPRRGSHQRR
jgi:response regulator RpfG family c-di-GMP phosphodiesterase